MKNDDLWKADGEVITELQRLIANFHPALALIDKQIAVIMRAKASKSAPYGKVMKAPKVMAPLCPDDIIFVIELAADTWATYSNDQRTACLDRHLCAMNVEEDEKNPGEVKCSLRRPDVSYFHAELDRHGDWMPRDQESDGPSYDVEAKLKSPTA